MDKPIPEAVRALLADWRDQAKRLRNEVPNLRDGTDKRFATACDADRAADELTAALTAAQQQGQAVAWVSRRDAMFSDAGNWRYTNPVLCSSQESPDLIPLYTAPPSAPVGVDWTDERIIAVCKAAGVRWIEADEEEGGFPGGFDITHMPEMRRLFTALAQQPAAVDEAMAERFCRRWYEITGRSLERAHVLASLDVALAAQHQEPTT